MSKVAHSTSDVPAQIFEAVLVALAETKVEADKIARLRKTLIEDANFTEQAIRSAVMSEENVP